MATRYWLCNIAICNKQYSRNGSVYRVSVAKSTNSEKENTSRGVCDSSAIQMLDSDFRAVLLFLFVINEHYTSELTF